MIKVKVQLIKKILENERYHVRYDGANLVIAYKEEFRKGDLRLFKRQVLPFIKHPEKKKESLELLNGYYVRDCYKDIVKIVAKNPKIDNFGISQIISRKGNQRQLSALTEANFLKRERKKVDESFKYSITPKGIKWIAGSD